MASGRGSGSNSRNVAAGPDDWGAFTLESWAHWVATIPPPLAWPPADQIPAAATADHIAGQTAAVATGAVGARDHTADPITCPCFVGEATYAVKSEFDGCEVNEQG